MKKILFVCVSLCIILFVAAGCAESIISTLPTDDSSTPAQSTDGASTTPPIPTQSEKPTNSGGNKMDDSCKLIVRGKDITAGNYAKLNFEYRYAELPLTAVMKELGAKVEWQDKITSKITFNGKDYLLDTTKGSLIEVGGTFNVLMVAPGSKHGIFHKVVGGEFIIDSDSAKMLIINMMGAKISIDYESQIISIG